MIFFWQFLHFKRKNSFQILTPDISRTKQPREIKKKKKKLKQKDATFMYNLQDLRIRTVTKFFLSSFRSRKKCEETTRLAKGTWNMWNTLSQWPNVRFSSRNHTLQNPVGFFQFYRFAAEISHFKYWPFLQFWDTRNTELSRVH